MAELTTTDSNANGSHVIMYPFPERNSAVFAAELVASILVAENTVDLTTFG
jgi:hypothetical protein